MRVLLRNTQTGLFFAGQNQWTDDHSEAVDFEATDRALDRVSAEKLEAMEILMRFDDPHFEIPLTIAGLGG